VELEYSVNQPERRVTATVAGQFDRDVFLEMLERMRAHGTWSYGVLLDLRQMVGLPALQDIRDIAYIATRPGPDDQRRGPLAIVTSDASHYAMACTYAALSIGRPVDVFRDRSDAELWLLKRTPMPSH
jgi:hypothetical protein